MRRAGLVVLLAVGFACSMALSAVPGSADNGTTTTTTTTAETTTAPPAPPTTTSTAPTTTAPAPAGPVLPNGVRIAGVPVGGLTPSAAFLAVQSSFDEPLHVVVGPTRLAPTRAQLGAIAYVRGAITRAKAAAPGSAVDLTVAVDGSTLRTYLRGLAARYDRKPVDARLTFRGAAPYVTKERPGLRLQVGAAAAAVVRALKSGSAKTVALPTTAPKPAVTRAGIGSVIVIHRGEKRLQLYRGMTPWRTFVVATGQPAYPTPLGRFQIVAMYRNPWWYPPASPWAAGEKPVPPGPGNPLGTRWMGISSPGVGIHGTPDAASLGYSASHGCVRMAIPQAEWLFDHVDVGTPVYIVAT